MRHVVIGTAGHVDHGKTTLVKRLTGVNTDRLKEEQERGLTIELGFAPFKLPSGRQAAIVDVPGHERFIHHMLAGAAGIDLVLLVVAADEGVMPQTVEHLDILTLLQVQRGIIVLNKIDLVEPEWRELVSEEIREKVKGTALAEAPITPVSAATGEGVDRLVALIDELTAEKYRAKSAVLRLPIDRVFALQGHGTVVTGTLWGGKIRPGDAVAILPSGKAARVRQVQVHGSPVEAAEAGQRVALNLGGVEKEEIARGEVVTAPGELTPTRLLDVKLAILERAPRGVAHGDQVRLHVGTSEVLARVRFLDRDEVQPGESAWAQLHLAEPLVAVRDDLFVVRSYSPARTLGGGRIIDAHPPRHRRMRAVTVVELAREERGDPADLVALALARSGGRPLTVERLARTAMLDPGRTQAELEKACRAGTAAALGEGHYLDAQAFKAVTAAAKEALAEFHERFPLRPGMPKEELRSRVAPRWESKEFGLLLETWQGAGQVKAAGREVALAGHDPAVSAEQERRLKAIEKAIAEGGVTPPTLGELQERWGLAPGMAEELSARLVKEGRLVKVSEELYFSPEALGRVREVLRDYFAAEKTLEPPAFKDRLGLSRKFAIPLLEYCDRMRWTRRVAEVRIAGPALAEPPGGSPGS
ncbi:MAG: selenocysteine-specific translation elongation factor [Bacillota bacterium]|nr:selenocysteine-specific translation elongation factor [Bacillota bacterium]